MSRDKRHFTHGQPPPDHYTFSDPVRTEDPDAAMEEVRRLFEGHEIQVVILCRLKRLLPEPMDYRLVQSLEDLCDFGRQHALEMDEFHHFEVVRHETPRVPDLGPDVHPYAATVFCLGPLQNLRQILAIKEQ